MAKLRSLLADHEADIVGRLRQLREQIIPLERELAEVRRARSAITLIDHGPEQVQITFEDDVAGGTRGSETKYAPPSSPFDRMTIKHLVLKALSDHFERGATANELLAFFADAYGRTDIVRTSLSPQLSRLKQDGEVILIGQKWSLPTAHTRSAADGNVPNAETAADQ